MVGAIGLMGIVAAVRPAPVQATVSDASVGPGVNSVSAFGGAAVEPGARGPLGTASLVGIAGDPVAAGYWVVTSTGQVTALGQARNFGSVHVRLNQPIVGMAATPTGGGYWLVAADGGVFNFGDARFYGSTGGIHLNQPVVGMAAGPSDHGYWLVASDGGIFEFGDARFYGSTGNVRLNRPVVGMAPAAAGGYWLVASDGGIFNFGAAPFKGSGASSPGSPPAVGMAPNAAGGYWIAYGRRLSPIPAVASYVSTRVDNVTVAVADLTTGETYAYRPGVVEHTASTVKVDILATLLREAQAEGRGLTPAEQSLAVPMIEDSLDSAADTLWGDLGAAAVGATEQALGLVGTFPATDGVWGTTTTTAADRLAMVRALVFPNLVLSDASRSYILNLMEHVTPSQDWGATGGVPAGVTVALKNGFSIINGWQINSMGWVHGDGRDYLIAMLTDGNPTEGYGIATVDQIAAIVWNSL